LKAFKEAWVNDMHSSNENKTLHKQPIGNMANGYKRCAVSAGNLFSHDSSNPTF